MRFALLAQLVEQRAFNPWVLGSSPKGRTKLNNNITENITIHVLTIGERRKNELWD